MLTTGGVLLTETRTRFVALLLALSVTTKVTVYGVGPAALNVCNGLAAVLLGVGRAVGETMAVLMATGHAVHIPNSILDSVRTLTATIAAELGEVVFGGPHYRILFLIGVLLFAVTFVANLAADIVMHRLKARMEGKR